MTKSQFHLSQIDTERFGFITVRANIISTANLAEFDRFCYKNAVQLSIVRVDTSHLDVVQAMEVSGYRLMDTLIYYAFNYARKTIPDDSSTYLIRPIQPDDLEEVVAIATGSFKGYYGHYHADPRLSDDKCDEVYIDWASKSVSSRKIANEVLVVVDDNQLNGFATLRTNNAEEGEGVLFGVAPHAQGQGVYQTMMIHGMKWCQEQGSSRMVVSTQITNIAVQKVWARLGFEMDHSYYTLHKWFDSKTDDS
jgi:GNAT superfamily N-acetyltransferase